MILTAYYGTSTRIRQVLLLETRLPDNPGHVASGGQQERPPNSWVDFFTKRQIGVTLHTSQAAALPHNHAPRAPSIRALFWFFFMAGPVGF
jgi:hypothetical protein